MPADTPRRRLRYQVAVSLDGFISRRGDDDYSWIVADSAIDFATMLREFDTAVLGRKTWDVARAMGQDGVTGLDAIVFSKTLPAESRKKLRVTADDPVATVRQLKQQSGKDIWLFGGGELFRTLLDAGLVDTVELALVPVLLGDGIPLLPPGRSAKLTLVDQKVLRSGIVMLAYSVPGGAPAQPIRYVKSTPAKKKAQRTSATKAKRKVRSARRR